MQHLVKYCQCYGSAYHCFSTFGFLDFVDLYLFCAYISDLYPPNFYLLICSMQHLVKYCQCYGSAYHCFSTFWTSGTFAKFAVDFFAHNLHFQVRLVEDECRAVAHHIRVIQASGTNNTKSTTELSPVLIRILLRVQTPEPRLHTRLQVGLPSTYPCIQG